MKKIVAMMLAVLLVLALTVSAFAEMRSVWEWNEELQHWEVRIYEVEDDVSFKTPEELGRDCHTEGLDPEWEEIIAHFRPN